MHTIVSVYKDTKFQELDWYEVYYNEDLVEAEKMITSLLYDEVPFTVTYESEEE